MAEAFAGILTLVGAGGLTSVAVGYLAFRTEAAKGRRGGGAPAVPEIGGAFPTARDVDLLVGSLTLLTGATNRLVALHEEAAKHRAVAAEVEHALAAREMRYLVEDMVAERDRRT